MTIRPIANPVRLAQDEINRALEQAAAVLDTHDLNADAAQAWEACRKHLREARGALLMLDIQGGVVLCDECLGLLDALERDDRLSRNKGLDALLYGLLLLPRYLSRVSEQRRELPATLLPTLNALRTIRRTVPLPDYHFAAFDRVDLDLVCLKESLQPTGHLEATVRRLRLMLQIGLLGLFRKPDSPRHAQQVHRALQRMGTAFGDTRTGRWMRLASHCMEAVMHGQIAVDPSVRLLLSRIDLHVRAASRDGMDGLDRLPPDMVIRGLLYYTALGAEQQATLRQLRDALGLKAAMAPRALIEHEREALTAPERSVLEAASQAVREELETLKAAIESAGRAEQMRGDERAALSQQLGSLGSTMTVLGLSEAAALLKREQTRLHSLRDDAPAARMLETLQHTAESLTLAEEQLYGLTRPRGGPVRRQRPNRLLEAEAQAVSECLVNLARVRSALEFLNGDVDEGEDLRNTDRPMQEASGILIMLEQTEAARILEQCRSQIARLPDHAVDDERLEVLADALAGLEWFLDGLRAGEDDEESLELANEALRGLSAA